MNYGTVSSDGLITAPIAMCSNFEGVGAWHTLTDDERAMYGWYPCDMVNEAYDPLTQSRSEAPVLSFKNGRISAAYSIVEKTLQTIQSEMLQRLADYRFVCETQGLDLESGLRILTDRESQSQLCNAYTTVKTGLIPDTDWKCRNGWQVVTLAEIEPIAKAMAAHVRACFRAEREVATEIGGAADIDQIVALSISTRFASAYRASFDEVMLTKQVAA